MSDEHGFGFGEDIRPAAERDNSLTTGTNPTDIPDSENPEATSATSTESSNGVVRKLRKKYDAESDEISPASEKLLLKLGLALYKYDVQSLSALIRQADLDPEPPMYVKDILPLVRRLSK
jgi:hypothetical protein